MKNRVEDLRNHLFETIERLKDEEKPMEIDRARAVSEVARVIVESAKVEVDHLRALEALGVRVEINADGSVGTGFIGAAPKLKAIK